MMKNRVIILSGPSCVGKTPLLKALRRNHPQINFVMPVLYSSRKARPGEKDGIDYHFRSAAEIQHLPSQKYIIEKVRQVWQAIDIEEIADLVQTNSLLILEIYPTLAKKFSQNNIMQKYLHNFSITTIFISPFIKEEISQIQQNMGYTSAAETAAAIMSHKQVNRALKQGKILSPDELNDIQVRAGKAWEEINMADSYDHLIINHDNEDSDNWRFSPPLGEAGKTLKTLIDIITNK